MDSVNENETSTQEDAATEEKSFGEDLMVITDEDISKEIYGSYQGFKFNCPVCKVPSIMVNQDMMPICLKCGRKVVVRSKIVEQNIKLRS